MLRLRKYQASLQIFFPRENEAIRHDLVKCTADAREPWTDSRHSCSEYLIIHFDYLIIPFDYLIIFAVER